ncbi:uncharacterized protein LOC129918622 isoform X2 [Episyrphus balteatus]|uniref:uncharacterized protein LOC129918622 isoform X2 n=1 Tax=Episyrphus balteatus TaxID=286459 RepID=UPI002486BC98|nr:uncharacterized protein LOC129918622 isoform X2 [Episyrphus balteatus]
MAFARHNIEKNRLIEMVRQNPILWDCRLPHYKRSDKKKDIKWCELGRAFNVSGERVQRTFTSLREIFRRELNHEKLLGARFTSKWEYYGAMSFLKDVIRERKTRERFRRDGLFKDIINEYNCNEKHQNKNGSNLKPDVIMNDSPPPLNHEISSSRSSTPSISIKEEPTDHDGDDECNDDLPKPAKRRRKNPPQTLPTNNERYPQNGSPTNGGPSGSTSNYQGQNAVKNQSSYINYTKKSSDDDDESEEEQTKVIKQTPREILYTKFGEFLSARLNTLNETVANELMNRILLLVAENR